MSVLFYGSILFVLALSIHVIVWKIRLPTHQKTIQLLLFATVLAASIFVFIIGGGSINLLGVSAPHTVAECVQLFMFFCSLSLAYMVTYSAIEADSPSLIIVMAVASSGKDGLDKKIFEQRMNNEILLLPRVNDLISEKLAYIENDRYKLTSKGLMFARIFHIYRKLLNRPQMGG